jgi:hypothetical protein
MTGKPTMTSLKSLLAAGAALAATTARAHEGHGLPGPSHWHATDAVGLVLAVAVAAGAWLWIRRK